MEGAHEKYDRLIARCKSIPPTPTAVAHPCDESSLRGAIDASRVGLIVPILVGPTARIREVAEKSGLDISRFRIVDAGYSQESAARAVELVRNAEAEALMKGSLHTDELMASVVKRETGLRTARRISHCFVMDVPGHPDPLIITDAAVNIAPTLKDKVDIVQNAIDLLRDLGATEIRVAVLSAMETVNPDVPSTLEAAALCKMADRGQITGALVDGPLALDNAISPEAAKIKKIDSPVAGRANVLVVPDLEAGNMLAKSLTFLGGADAAGIVLGAKVPIILTSRADSLISRLASCAVATLVADARRSSARRAVR
jgi:phosphate acetyltransferase